MNDDIKSLKTPSYIRRAIKKREESIINKSVSLNPEKDAPLIEAIEQDAQGNFTALARKLLREHYQLPPETEN